MIKERVANSEEPLNVMRSFYDEIKKLVEGGRLSSGDIVTFVDAAEQLLAKAQQSLSDSKQTQEWRSDFGNQVSKVFIINLVNIYTMYF